MTKKIHVGNLPLSATDEDLRGLFERFSSVESIRIVVDRETGRSRGFGFVELADAEGAEKAIGALDGAEIRGRAIRVSVSGGPHGAGGGERGSGGGHGTGGGERGG